MNVKFRQNKTLETNQAFETLPQKIIRHLLAGQVDPYTILRGIQQIIHRPNKEITSSVPHYDKTDPWMDTNIQISKYSFQSNENKNHSEKSFGSAFVVDFPEEFMLQIKISNRMMDNQRDCLEMYSGALASVSGPTCASGIPNNGFYMRDFQKEKYPDLYDASREVRDASEFHGSDQSHWKEAVTRGELVLFQDTDPAGQRRGAMLQKNRWKC